MWPMRGGEETDLAWNPVTWLRWGCWKVIPCHMAEDSIQTLVATAERTSGVVELCLFNYSISSLQYCIYISQGRGRTDTPPRLNFDALYTIVAWQGPAISIILGSQMSFSFLLLVHSHCVSTKCINSLFPVGVETSETSVPSQWRVCTYVYETFYVHPCTY